MFNKVLTDVNSAFAAVTWTANSIAMYPSNYQGSISNADEFCRFNVLPSESENKAHGGLVKSLSGLLMIKIFVKAGEGQGRTVAISDILNISFENKNFTNGTEFGTSYLSVEGLDSANQSLYSATYTLPFNIYGE